MTESSASLSKLDTARLDTTHVPIYITCDPFSCTTTIGDSRIVNITGAEYADMIPSEHIALAHTIHNKFAIIRNNTYIERVHKEHQQTADILILDMKDCTYHILVVNTFRDIYIDGKLLESQVHNA